MGGVGGGEGSRMGCSCRMGKMRAEDRWACQGAGAGRTLCPGLKTVQCLLFPSRPPSLPPQVGQGRKPGTWGPEKVRCLFPRAQWGGWLASGRNPSTHLPAGPSPCQALSRRQGAALRIPLFPPLLTPFPALERRKDLPRLGSEPCCLSAAMARGRGSSLRSLPSAVPLPSVPTAPSSPGRLAGLSHLGL